jgi:DNA-binding SARP family transcriptional activator
MFSAIGSNGCQEKNRVGGQMMNYPNLFDLPEGGLIQPEPELNCAYDLIENGQYQQLAELLQKIQNDSRRSGALPDEILSAALHICLECSRSQADLNWHRQAQADACRRELDLRNRLCTLIKVVNEMAGFVDQPLASAPLVHHTEDIVDIPASAQSVPESEKKKVTLSIQCLGPFRVYKDEIMISCWSSIKGQLILKYMIKHRRTPIAKEVLMEAFWPDADPESARRNLHQAIYNLRQTLRKGRSDFQPILFINDCYLFNPDLNLKIDFEDFEHHVQAGRRYESVKQMAEACAEYRLAEELYVGDFLEEDSYEHWASIQREQLRNTYLDITDRLSEYLFQNGDYDTAIQLCQKLLTKDSCHEGAHRRVMQYYQKLGHRGQAIRQYRLCEEILKNELDAAPSDETQSLFERIIGAGQKLGQNIEWLASKVK